MASETELVVGAFTYLLVVAFLLNQSGLAAGSLALPGGNGPFQQGTDGGQSNVGFQVGSGLACAGTLALGFVTLGLGLVGSVFTCGAFIGSFVAPAATVDAFHFVFAFIAFFFQLISYQLPINPILNTLIIMPAAVLFGFVGVRILRGLAS